MKKFLLRIFLIATLLGAASQASAQIVSADSAVLDTDSLRRDFDSRPYFGLYKDNYFTFGVPIGDKINKHNSNVKFQISIAQRLTNSCSTPRRCSGTCSKIPCL